MAATNTTRFSDQQYRNWLKDTLSLLYLKEALEDIVDIDAIQFHQGLQKALGVFGAAPSTCSSCTQNSIIKDFRRRKWLMTCSLCDQWLQQIVQNHANKPLPSLHRENTDPQLWPTNPYEVFKCYMPYGCQQDQSAVDGDVQSILKLIQNCLHFSTSGRIGRLDLVDKLLEIRNSLFHSGNFLVADPKLQADMQTMLDFLGGLTALSDVEQNAVDEAIDKILQLQANKIDLSLNRELELRALQQQQIVLEKDLRTHRTTLTAELVTHSASLKAVKSDMKSLQKEVKSATVKGAATDLAVKTIQTELGANSTKLTTVFSEVKSLQKDVRSATATELDVKTLTEKTKGLELRMQKLQVVRDKFARFLQANDLEQDLGKLSHIMEQHGQRIQTLEEQAQAQRSEIESCKRTLCDHEEELKTKRLKTGSDTGQMTEADITDLQKCLVSYYRRMCLTIPNPVEDDDVGLNRLYVDPDFRVLRETTDPSAGLKKVEDQATTSSQCRRLFKTKNYRCEQIYLTGNAGSGKSMFCKHLVSLWCVAHDDTDEHTSSNRDDGSASSRIKKRRIDINQQREEDKKIMSDFPLLFYITLRDVSDMYHIEDMIDDQIFQQNNNMQHFKASVVLEKCCCLVILDGLDEWVRPTNAKPLRFLNPGIPGRNRSNESNVFFTTTRPWKLDVLSLKSSEIDKHAELVGFDSIASKTLYSQLSHLLNKSENVRTSYDKFKVELEKKGLSHSHNLPVILTQLICLTFDGQDLGQSQVQLYCSMLEMLLKRSEKTRTATLNTEHPENVLPKCFIEYNICQANQDLLLKLGRVAFEALFNKEREKSLVFKSSQISIFGVDKESIDLCLKSGILSQNKVLGKRSVCEKEMSFLHKKLQEFLAAIFITHNEERENVLSRVKSYCSTVEKMLEMYQICMFVSGLNIEVACKLLTYFMTRVVCNDTAVQQYRQNTDSPRYTCIHSIQTCIVDCSIEALNNQHTDNLPLQDFIIEKQTISECLKRLLVTNISAVKSVYIDTGLMTPDDVEFAARTLHQLQDKQCLQKLYLRDPRNVNFDDETLSKTITNNSNLSSLVLRDISLSTETSAAVCGALKHLTALQLYWVKLPHEEKQRLLSSVSQAAALRELILWGLDCTDHGDDCSPGIDISQLNTSCLQHITLDYVTIQDRQLRQFVRQLSSVSHKVTVELVVVTVTADGENPVDLSYLTHDRCLVGTLLWNICDNIWHIDFHTQQQTTTLVNTIHVQTCSQQQTTFKADKKARKCVLQ